MPKGLFPRFIAALRNDWAHSLPTVARVDKALGPVMPKASTFVVLGHRHVSGVVPYLFLRFQHHSKAWAAGQFTINAITSARYGAPTRDVRKIGAFHRGEDPS